MVVRQSNVTGAPVLETEYHTPVGPYRNAPESFPVSFQRVESETGQVHVLWYAGAVQNGEDVLYLRNLVGTDPLSFVVFEQPLQTFVPEVLDHTCQGSMNTDNCLLSHVTLSVSMDRGFVPREKSAEKRLHRSYSCLGQEKPTGTLSLSGDFFYTKPSPDHAIQIDCLFRAVLL